MDDLGRLELEFLSTIQMNYPYEPSGFLMLLVSGGSFLAPIRSRLEVVETELSLTSYHLRSSKL